MDDFALELGPTVDDLAEFARAAGEKSASKQTINRWVKAGYVLRPRQQQRKWRYPNAAVGQVDSLARMRVRGVHEDFFAFGLFVEAGTGDPELTRAFLLEFLGYWEQGLAREKARLADTDVFRDEAKSAARKKGKNAPLPHRVRMTLDERTLAMQYLFSQLVSVQLPARNNSKVSMSLNGCLAFAAAEAAVPET